MVATEVITDEDDLMIINKSGTTIRLHADSVKVTKGRVAQGTKLIELKKRNDVISHLSVVPRTEDEEVETVADNPEPQAETTEENK